MGTFPKANYKYSTTIYQVVPDSAVTTFFPNAVPPLVPTILIIDPGTAKEEKVLCSAKTVNSITVERGYGGTTATDHAIGASLVDFNTNEYINNLVDVLDANFDDDGTPSFTGFAELAVARTWTALQTFGSALLKATRPLFVTSIDDTNGNELIQIGAAAAAVNQVKVSNAATAGNPVIEAAGDDTNVSLDFKAKGTGTMRKPTSVVIQVIGPTTDLATGDGKFYFTIPPEVSGLNLTAVHARVITAGTTGTTDIQIANVTDAVDLLSTKLTIDSTETGSDTAAAPGVINTATDDMATNDLIRIDIDAVSTTAPKGLILRLTWALP